jgi:uncharacterized protein (UPF0276 family)
MKLAVNYSTPLKNLIETNQVRVDLLKCPEWEGLVNPALELGPVYIHFDIELGSGSIQRLNFDLIKRMFEKTDTIYLNTHLSNLPSRKKDKTDSAKSVLSRWEADLEILRRKIPSRKVIAENLPWHPMLPELEIASDPGLINKFLVNNDVGLLLDLSHAQISATRLGIGYQEYVSLLPLDRLRELHITGIRKYAGHQTDHFELQPHDWHIVEWAASQIRSGAWHEPDIVAFEYGGVGDVFCWRTEPDALRQQVPILYEMFGDK